MIRIQQASGDDMARVRSLFEEYASALGIDLCFQGFEDELASLPGGYAPPRGALLLAWDGGVPVGCVALRPFEWPRVAELKRLYVVPAARGRGLGLQLSEAAVSFAREAGYASVRLDTLPTMTVAQGVYQSLGFKMIDAYRFNPVEGVQYMELNLLEGHTAQGDGDV